MVKKSWRLDQLNEMRSKLSHEGWILDSRIPDGWAMKIKPRSDCIKYITPSGEELSSTRAAVIYLKKNNGSRKDMKKFQSLLKIRISGLSV